MCNPARCLVRFATGGPKERSHGEARSEVMLANRNGYRQKALYVKDVSLENFCGVRLWNVFMGCVTEACLWSDFVERTET